MGNCCAKGAALTIEDPDKQGKVVEEGQAPVRPVSEDEILIKPEVPAVDDQDGISPASRADAALIEAQQLLDSDSLFLEAENSLARTLADLEAPEAGADGADAARIIRTSPTFEAVVRRVEQFDAFTPMLQPSGYANLWSKEDAALYVNAPAGASWFEYRVVALVDGSLGEVAVALNELDLQIKYQKMLLRAPSTIGPRKRHLMVTHSLLKLLMFRIEMITEVLRRVDTSVGFLAECIRSDFPSEHLTLPPKHWQNVRIRVATKQLAIPCGGGQAGTITIQTSRVDVGFRIPEVALHFFCNRLAKDYLENLKKCVRTAKDPSSAWHERLQKDVDGFYAELAAAEEAASRRQAFSVNELPGPEIFERSPRLTPQQTVPPGNQANEPGPSKRSK
mmetsp:Transcript_104182/g.206947  ORF Transcript_104182/g.206947 Transcript_104182/m.206947 type:complete len:392 (-) Transcript_104182:82-1257(-)